MGTPICVREQYVFFLGALWKSSLAGMERYTYPPLASELYRIRLLRLLPGSTEEDIRCEIFHYTLRVERAFFDHWTLRTISMRRWND
jgi:hypothetical protein